MDFAFTEDQERLRLEVRQLCTEELGPDWFAVDQWSVHSRPFSKKLAEKGWIGMTWPKEYGGKGASQIDRLVVTEELLRYGAPVGYHWLGDRQVGPAILKMGTDEQKQEFLPKIINADVAFSLLFSETEAGSDLANVKTRADEQGDVFVVNGAKLWSSFAHSADYGWLLAVTDPNAEKKYNGMSEFIMDLRLPGIEVRPIVDSTGEHHFNEVFLDQVPVPSNRLVGVKNKGWVQLMAQVDHERSGMERIMGNWPIFEATVRYVREMGKNGTSRSDATLVRHKLANLRVEFEVGRLLIYRVAWMLSQGKSPNYESAMAKEYGCRFEQRMVNGCMEVLGMGGLVKPGSSWMALDGQVAKSYLRSPSYTLMGGATEILRGIVALRGLGMPSR